MSAVWYPVTLSAGLLDLFSQNRLHPRLASMRLQSITLHFEDKEERGLEWYLTGKGRLQDAHCKVSLSNMAREEHTRSQRVLDQMGRFHVATEIPFHVMPCRLRLFWKNSDHIQQRA